MNIDPVVRIGKDGLTPEIVKAASEALAARELIKVGILNNCFDDPKYLAEGLSERTRSQVVQIIGKKIVLYKEGDGDKKKIIL